MGDDVLPVHAEPEARHGDAEFRGRNVPVLLLRIAQDSLHQARQTVPGLQLTPDEKYVIASVFESAATPARNTIVPNYVTDSVYTEDIAGRSNVGDSQGSSRLAILNVETGEVKWVDHCQKKASAPASDGTAPASAERDIQMLGELQMPIKALGETL